MMGWGVFLAFFFVLKEQIFYLKEEQGNKYEGKINDVLLLSHKKKKKTRFHAHPLSELRSLRDVNLIQLPIPQYGNERDKSLSSVQSQPQGR
ncbi:hypothetical protein BDF20DRAFT_466537 [Mycotypha africana]|uniref:uncharacterized protein n=1 Tax=Mycotypha africana TaxID=64632 RepID=UPI002300B846|nr:uncharacterized protein BDF20DRAFT_466537 [Mycotypha africana]KAI8982347.1 hypothetical protein BDF20DRAFT_466537 [Mycotypha africana]